MFTEIRLLYPTGTARLTIQKHYLNQYLQYIQDNTLIKVDIVDNYVKV